jgi:hypothetical protein
MGVLLQSLAYCSSVFGHGIVVLFLPWGHVSRKFSCEGALTLLLEGLLSLESVFSLFESLIVLLIFPEDLGILTHILLVRNPCFIKVALLMVGVFNIIVNSTNVIVIDSVFNVIEVLMSDWKTIFCDFI